MPSPLKCLISLVPRPSFPDYVLAPPSDDDEKLMPQLLRISQVLSPPEPVSASLSSDQDDPLTLQSAFLELISSL